ncbi:hypothetical protein [Moryella indoligenes]|uniref:hypothetical protein n=1 Tax=Moryella indoligenes TaxID=371674 RepID=UPI001FA7F0A0|nr:hypothetical protein [Moryella indoligenes]
MKSACVLRRQTFVVYFEVGCLFRWLFPWKETVTAIPMQAREPAHPENFTQPTGINHHLLCLFSSFLPEVCEFFEKALYSSRKNGNIFKLLKRDVPLSPGRLKNVE